MRDNPSLSLLEPESLMATPPVFDLGALLTKISEAQPAGADLRSEASSKEDRDSFRAVRDARKKAADAERRLREFALLTKEEREAELSAPDAPDWEAVCRLALAALTRSKDLWITAWLIEGLTRRHGFAGLRDGYRLASDFCKGFWTDVHPQDLSERFAQLVGLNGTDSEGTLIPAITNVPIAAATSMRPLSCADYQDALELQRKDPKLRERRVQQGAVTVEMFERAIAEARVDDLRNVLDDLQQALDAYVGFNTLLSQNVSDASLLPPSSRIRETLDECLRMCRGLTKDVLKDGQVMTGNQTANKAGDAATDPSADLPHSFVAPGTVAAGIQTRQQALSTLLRVAEYFRHAEPHSPVSYALEQAVRWAGMPLPELLSELVTDKGAREEIFKRAGITQPKADK